VRKGERTRLCSAYSGNGKKEKNGIEKDVPASVSRGEKKQGALSERNIRRGGERGPEGRSEGSRQS